jgi:hypothetical protein
VRTYGSLTITGENAGGDLFRQPEKTGKTRMGVVNLMKNG